MPQFDVLITFPIIKDLLIVLTLYYLVFTSVIVTNLRVLKFRKKTSKLFNFRLNTVLLFRSYFLNK